MERTYEWDAAKNRANVAKHGLNFAAEIVLDGPSVTFRTTVLSMASCDL